MRLMSHPQVYKRCIKNTGLNHTCKLLWTEVCIAYSFLFFPQFDGRFVLLEFMTPIGINFLVIIGFGRSSTSELN
jgi:hypothetical protein